MNIGGCTSSEQQHISTFCRKSCKCHFSLKIQKKSYDFVLTRISTSSYDPRFVLKASLFFTHIGVSGAEESGPGHERIDASNKYSPFIDVESKEDANGNFATYVVLGIPTMNMQNLLVRRSAF